MRYPHALFTAVELRLRPLCSSRFMPANSFSATSSVFVPSVVVFHVQLWRKKGVEWVMSYVPSTLGDPLGPGPTPLGRQPLSEAGRGAAAPSSMDRSS
jgi:hypothetical protein